MKARLQRVYSRNGLLFDTRNSGNPTYRAHSTTSFYDRALTYDRLVTGLDFACEVTLDDGTLNVAFGTEYRREGLAIGAGEPAS